MGIDLEFYVRELRHRLKGVWDIRSHKTTRSTEICANFDRPDDPRHYWTNSIHIGGKFRVTAAYRTQEIIVTLVLSPGDKNWKLRYHLPTREESVLSGTEFGRGWQARILETACSRANEFVKDELPKIVSDYKVERITGTDDSSSIMKRVEEVWRPHLGKYGNVEITLTRNEPEQDLTYLNLDLECCIEDTRARSGIRIRWIPDSDDLSISFSQEGAFSYGVRLSSGKHPKHQLSVAVAEMEVSFIKTMMVELMMAAVEMRPHRPIFEFFKGDGLVRLDVIREMFSPETSLEQQLEIAHGK